MSSDAAYSQHHFSKLGASVSPIKGEFFEAICKICSRSLRLAHERSGSSF